MNSAAPVAAIRDWGFLFLVPLFLGDAFSQDTGKEKTSPEWFRKGDRIILLGGTLAERAQYSGHLETALQRAFPEKRLTVRNMGWSGDEVSLMPRPLEFGTLEENLERWEPDVLFLFFGGNEAFAGQAGLEKFENDYRALLARITPVARRLVLFSPAAHEKRPPPWPDPASRNRDLRLYTAVIRKIAEEDPQLAFVDLFHPTRTLMAQNYQAPLTINGIHFTPEGYRVLSGIVAAEMGWPEAGGEASGELRQLVIEKNRQFFLRWRPVNSEYVFGRRKTPFGVVSYPPEMQQLEKQIAELDRQIHEKAAP